MRADLGGGVARARCRGDRRSDAPRCPTPRHAMSQPWGHEPGMAPLPEHVRKAIRKVRRAASRSPAARRGRRRRRVLVALVAALVVAIAGVGGSYGYARMRFGQIAAVDVPSLKAQPPAGKPFNLLIVGSDGSAKVNAAFVKGPNQLVDTIQRALGVPINHYLLVDFGGFRRVVDAVGGIDLDFPVPVRDWKDGRNNSGLDVPAAGCRRLDGQQALAL